MESLVCNGEIQHGQCLSCLYRRLGHRQSRPCRLGSYRASRDKAAGDRRIGPWSSVSEMELRAAVEALRLTPVGARIELRSDSELLIDGMRFLVFRWQRFGWRNSRGIELQHQELWRELILLNTQRTIRCNGSGGTAAIRSSPALMRLLPSRQSNRCSGTNCRLMPLAERNSSEGGKQCQRLLKRIRSLRSTRNWTAFSMKSRASQARRRASGELLTRFQQFCEAHGEKVDRIGRFLSRMEAREQFCRAEASRLSDRARAAAGKVERTKNMVLNYLMSRELKAIEGREFTLRAQKNSQDSVRITDDEALPLAYRKIDARVGGVLWGTVLANLPTNSAECSRVLWRFKARHRHDQNGHPARRRSSRR